MEAVEFICGMVLGAVAATILVTCIFVAVKNVKDEYYNENE